MKHVISAVVAVVCILVGGITGHFVKNGLTAAAGTSAHEADSHKAADAHGSEKKKDSHGAKKESSGHGGGGHGGGDASGDVVYFKFTREFIVPIMHDRKVESLVILNINLEADSSISQKLFSMEPKVRDNVMTTLIELSNDGRTFENITDVESYETIRAMVLLNLQKAVPSGIQNVLIVDIAQQDL
ncbi:hypothetical protein [Hyphomonas sp.]|uniref:hypothetical protein n=1 Tax=Hyphomonas sp. TaxID=87 RepID=UPI00352919E1